MSLSPAGLGIDSGGRRRAAAAPADFPDEGRRPVTRVVVVNPEREVAEVYAAMLRACGYEVDVCPA